VLVYHYGKSTALALWGSGPAFGMDANMLLSWHKYGVGNALKDKVLPIHQRECRVLRVWPDADAAAWLVQEAHHEGGRFSRGLSSAPWVSQSTCSPPWVQR